MLYFVLVVPFGDGEGARHHSVDSVGFAVATDVHVAVFLWFGGGDDAPGGFESSEGRDLRFGDSFGFGYFDHFFLWLHFVLFKSGNPYIDETPR